MSIYHASIRPEDIIISREAPEPNNFNSFQGIINHISDHGSVIHVIVNVPPEFTCLILRPSLEEMNLKEKQKVFISFRTSAVNIF